jgi:aryl-alcohol dehydrogenase-like predicted oxidoreductase
MLSSIRRAEHLRRLGLAVVTDLPGVGQQLLDDFVRSGKLRYLCTSTLAAWQLMEVLWVSKELGLDRAVCKQRPYRLLDRRFERQLVPIAETDGLALTLVSPG